MTQARLQKRLKESIVGQDPVMDQLAEKVGAASKAVVYQWESAKRKPSPVFWLRIQRLQRQLAISGPGRPSR